MSSKQPRANAPHRSPALLPMTLTSLLVLAIAAAIVFLGAQDPFGSWAAAGRAKTLPVGVRLGRVPAPGNPEDVAHMVTNPVGAAEDAAARTGEYPVEPAALITPVEEWVSDQVTAFDERTGAGRDELEISWAPILMAGPYLGIELTARAGADAAHRSVYADVTGDGAWTAPDDLFGPAAADRVAGFVRAAFNQPELAAAPHPLAPEAAELADRSMARARLHADGLILPLGDSERALVLDRSVAVDLLTARGRRILDVAIAGAAFEGLPAPEPPPSPPAELALPTTTDCARARCIALTFDDGPGAHTSRLLDLLADRDAPATFFVLGEQARRRPDLVRRMAEEGHVVGNHTWGHPDLATLTRREIDQQFVAAADEIEKAGAPRPVLVRPPYGSFSDDVRAAITEAGDAAVLWDVDTLDWQTRDTAQTIEAAIDGASRGGIILMHDIHEPTVAAVGTIVDDLRAAGYTLATVPDLFGGTMDSGAVYRHGDR